MGFAQAGLPGSDHHLHYHGSSSVAAAAAARRAYGKRWHYQVYRSGVGACELHSSSQDSESQSPESLQRNPLMMGGGDGEQPPNVANDSKLETKLAGKYNRVQHIIAINVVVVVVIENQNCRSHFHGKTR